MLIFNYRNEKTTLKPNKINYIKKNGRTCAIEYVSDNQPDYVNFYINSSYKLTSIVKPYILGENILLPKGHVIIQVVEYYKSHIHSIKKYRISLQ